MAESGPSGRMDHLPYLGLLALLLFIFDLGFDLSDQRLQVVLREGERRRREQSAAPTQLVTVTRGGAEG